MKICVTAKGKRLDAGIEPVFGRCGYFVIFDLESGSLSSLENPGSKASRVAGVRAAEALADSEVDILLTGSVGPNAFFLLSGAGIEVMVGIYGDVASAFSQYEASNLEPLSLPNAEFYAGIQAG